MSFFLALPHLLDPDPETDPMEHPALSGAQIDAMDETAEWSARAHPLPHPQPSHLRVVREPLPTQPFAPGVIERHEPKRGDIGLALMVAAAAAVFAGVWWVLG